MRRRIEWSLLLLLTAPLAARAQPVPAVPPVQVILETNHPEAAVYADSVWLGLAAQERFEVPPTTAQIRLLPASTDTWSLPPLTAALDAAPGDSVHLTVTFPYTYLIESVPYGATVLLHTGDGREKLGVTPLRASFQEPLRDPLVLERGGYIPEQITPGADLWNTHSVLLRPSMPTEDDENLVNWRPPSPRLRWLDYAALGVALGSGALAVHYKFKADRRYETYQQSRDPALENTWQQFDTHSAIALGTMQVGLGVFGLRLILR